MDRMRELKRTGAAHERRTPTGHGDGCLEPREQQSSRLSVERSGVKGVGERGHDKITKTAALTEVRKNI